MAFGITRIGEILVNEFDLPQAHLQEALDEQEEKKQTLREGPEEKGEAVDPGNAVDPIGQILIRLDHVNQETISRALARQAGLKFISNLQENGPIDDEIANHLEIGYTKHFEIIPLQQKNEILRVAVADPFNMEPIEDIEKVFRLPLELVVSTPQQIIDTINTVTKRKKVKDALRELPEDEKLKKDFVKKTDLLDIKEDSPVRNLVNTFFTQALEERASDIHIEPFEEVTKVRFRVDGVLKDIAETSKSSHAQIASIIKNKAELNIAEKRLPQDGRIMEEIGGRVIDIRVSTLPTTHGERVVMRILDRGAVLLGLGEIGMSARQRESFGRLITKPHGIILVTGPTGSGKTTTLYAALTTIDTKEKNVITIEDPVEYQIDNIGQIQVNAKINLTFANGLRSILRQDPDVVLVGEIRDLETAEIAIQASLTGHLVFSTLHTNDAASAITRLIDMGIEPFLVSSSVLAIMAQRLVRRVCPHCREAYTPGKAELTELALENEALSETVFYRAVGCSECAHTGYRGRTGIYEMMNLNDEIRAMILNTTDSNSIKKVAVQHGMRTLRYDGAQKILKGLTTAEEVLRVTQEDVQETLF
jgi:general secretion pathway protein E